MANPEPLLAEALNPRLALNRRLSAEGQAPMALPDLPPTPPGMSQSQFGGRPTTPEELAKRRALLIEFLRARDASRAR